MLLRHVQQRGSLGHLVRRHARRTLSEGGLERDPAAGGSLSSAHNACLGRWLLAIGGRSLVLHLGLQISMRRLGEVAPPSRGESSKQAARTDWVKRGARAEKCGWLTYHQPCSLEGQVQEEPHERRGHRWTRWPLVLLALAERASALTTSSLGWACELSPRSCQRMNAADLQMLVEIAERDERAMVARRPAGAGRYDGRPLCRASCQAARRSTTSMP